MSSLTTQTNKAADQTQPTLEDLSSRLSTAIKYLKNEGDFEEGWIKEKINDLTNEICNAITEEAWNALSSSEQESLCNALVEVVTDVNYYTSAPLAFERIATLSPNVATKQRMLQVIAFAKNTGWSDSNDAGEMLAVLVQHNPELDIQSLLPKIDPKTPQVEAADSSFD